MQYQVPQFIEVEDKIFGPFTLSQFIYLAGGVGFLVAMWLVLPLWLAIIVGVPVAGLGAALAFLKVNERPLIATIESAFDYFFRPKLYVWEKKQKAAISDIALPGENAEDPAKYVPAATANKIKDLAWGLDVHEHAFGAPDAGQRRERQGSGL